MAPALTSPGSPPPQLAGARCSQGCAPALLFSLCTSTRSRHFSRAQVLDTVRLGLVLSPSLSSTALAVTCGEESAHARLRARQGFAVPREKQGVLQSTARAWQARGWKHRQAAGPLLSPARPPLPSTSSAPGQRAPPTHTQVAVFGAVPPAQRADVGAHVHPGRYAVVIVQVVPSSHGHAVRSLRGGGSVWWVLGGRGGQTALFSPMPSARKHSSHACPGAWQQFLYSPQGMASSARAGLSESSSRGLHSTQPPSAYCWPKTKRNAQSCMPAPG